MMKALAGFILSLVLACAMGSAVWGATSLPEGPASGDPGGGSHNGSSGVTWE